MDTAARNQKKQQPSARNPALPTGRDTRLQVLQTIGLAADWSLAQRTQGNYWRAPMPAGRAQAALYLAASAVWRNLDAFDLELLNWLRLNVDTAQSRGERDLALACLAIADSDTHTPVSSSKTRRAGTFYLFLARMLKLAFGQSSGFFGFPWYPTLFDLAVHHWTFAPFRRILGRAALDQLPAIGLLREAGASRSALVRLWRALPGRFGAPRRARRTESLHLALKQNQQPNGCWSWTLMGTACSLFALRTVEANSTAEVERALRYLDDLRAKNEDGQCAVSWAVAAVWDSARAAELLLLTRKWTSEQSLAFSQILVEQIHDDGLTGFDTGISLGDHDSSAAVLAFLSKTCTALESAAPSWLASGIESIVEGLLFGQHSDGGWGFALGKPLYGAGIMPPGELRALAFDASSPDLTARVVLGLASAVRSGCLDVLVADRVAAALRQALKYFEATQDDDGSWWARWSKGRILSTCSVLSAACAAAADPASDFIVKGRCWLASESASLSGAVEASSCLGALIATSTQGRIESDPVIAKLAQQLIATQVSGTWTPSDEYPLVYGVDTFTAPLSEHYTVLFGLLFAERAFLKGSNQARREILWARSRPKPLPRQPVDSIEMARIQQAFLTLGQRLAGTPSSIGQRVVVHHSAYRDSRRNLTFPMLALHGAGWAHGYFNFLVSMLPYYASLRFPFSWQKRDDFKKKMSVAMTGFKVANQRVLRDTFANYHFTKQYGTTPGADKILPPTLITTLNQLHAATAVREPLTDLAKSSIYSECFQWEQHNSVWPMVEKAIKNVDDPIVKAIAFRPIVHFAFFPPLKFLFFHDFTDTNERIAQGWKAYGIAEDVGWAVTERAIGRFNFVPLDMAEYYHHLLDRLDPPPEFKR